MKALSGKFDPNKYAHLGIDEKKALLYRAIFENYSSMKNNYLTPGELRNIFEQLDIHTDQKEIFLVVCDYDTKELGYIDFEDFVKVLTDR